MIHERMAGGGFGPRYDESAIHEGNRRAQLPNGFRIAKALHQAGASDPSITQELADVAEVPEIETPMRAEAIRLLAEIPSELARKAILAAAQGDSTKERLRAEHYSTAHRTAGARAEPCPDEVRQAAVRALAMIGGREDLPLLRSIARSERKGSPALAALAQEAIQGIEQRLGLCPSVLRRVGRWLGE